MNVGFRDIPDAGDVAAVRDVVASTGFFSPEEVDVAAELVEERLAKGEASGYHFVFAEEDGVLRGYACFGPVPCTAGSFDLYWIVVAREGRGAGLGSLLLAEAERRVAAMGGYQLYAETSGREGYAPTRAFYERRGFAVAARLADFYARGEDKLIYAKALPAGPGA